MPDNPDESAVSARKVPPDKNDSGGAEAEPEERNEEEFLATARKRFAESVADEKYIREQALADLRYVAGDQWDQRTRAMRETGPSPRPCLTFNRCHTFVQQVSNEARQNKPQIKFVPEEENDRETAEIFEGLARHIQYDSNAQIAYETAVEYSAGGSFGYFRYLTDYVDNDSFDLELKILPVVDPFAVYGVLIPACFGVQPQYAFVVQEIPLEEFKQQYPDSAVNSFDAATTAQKSGGWIGKETVRVAEYWTVEFEEKTITRGEESRKIRIPHVEFCKINGIEILPDTETEWVGSTIPIIPVLGKQIFIDGKPQLFSVVRPQRDAQNLLNFYKTRIAETLATAPIQPYLVPKGSIAEEDKKDWATMNTVMRPYLEYEVQDVGGKPLPPPQRQVFEPPIAALSNAANQEIDDMKATTGIFDASLGAKSNEQSGLAIARRQSQSNVTNMHFMDNLERAFRAGGDILAEVIPKVYTGKRVVRILGADETPKLVKINQVWQGKHYKLGGNDAVKGHVVVTMGRSFSTKRMETADTLGNIIQTNEQLLPMVGDIYFRNSDFAGADQLAERFKKMLPPQLQDGQNGQIPPQVQQQMAQMSQQHQLLTQALNQANDVIKSKQVEQQAKIQIARMQELTRTEIVKMQEATKLAVAQINASKDANQAIAEQELKAFDILHGSSHELALQKDQQAHEADLQAGQQAHEQDLAAQQAAAQQQQAQSAEQVSG